MDKHSVRRGVGWRREMATNPVMKSCFIESNQHPIHSQKEPLQDEEPAGHYSLYGWMISSSKWNHHAKLEKLGLLFSRSKLQLHCLPAHLQRGWCRRKMQSSPESSASRSLSSHLPHTPTTNKTNLSYTSHPGIAKWWPSLLQETNSPSCCEKNVGNLKTILARTQHSETWMPLWILSIV